MTLMEFEQLSLHGKINVLYHRGTYIGKQKVRGKTILLYQVDGFYVEIFYRKHRYYIDRFRCFTSTRFIDPYLQEIKIERFA